MEIRFNVTKDERKALVKTIGEITGWAPVYKGAPSFAFAVNNYIIDRDGTLIYDERTDSEEVRLLLAELSARGFTGEGFVSEPTEDAPDDSEPVEVSVSEFPARKTITVDMPVFSNTALDNLKKLISGKESLIKKSIGAEDLTVLVIGSALHFNWFAPDSTEQELEAYKQFVSALCLTAKNQKRVTMKESAVDSEKFAFRCFLLRLGFIGAEYAPARKVLLSKLSGNGSFSSGDHKSRSMHGSSVLTETNAPQKCGECRYHCYYTEGLLLTNTGDAVDTSKRTPDKYTHYCLNTPSGFRRLKHATDWSGSETPPRWCAFNGSTAAESAEAVTVCDTGNDADSLAETLADAELIHAVNMSLESE